MSKEGAVIYASFGCRPQNRILNQRAAKFSPVNTALAIHVQITQVGQAGLLQYFAHPLSLSLTQRMIIPQKAGVAGIKNAALVEFEQAPLELIGTNLHFIRRPGRFFALYQGRQDVTAEWTVPAILITTIKRLGP